MTAPHKLKDGSGKWDDGVLRAAPIKPWQFSINNPRRYHVVKLGEQWHPCVGNFLLTVNGFRTHAEAIAYADKLARLAWS